MYDAAVSIAQARIHDLHAAAARRALLAVVADAPPMRNAVRVKIGHVFVGIGGRIEGVQYAPVAPLSQFHASR